jgi:APA family basic amino acid/polyamine antiporter
MPRPYRAWGYPITPLVFIAFSLYLIGNTILAQPKDSMIGGGLLLLGLPIYWYYQKKL